MGLDASGGPISVRLAEVATGWANAQYELVVLAGELAGSAEWVVAGSSTPAHHVAAIADVEVCTAREWLRVARRVRVLPRVADAFADGSLSYSKVRALLCVATPDNEAEVMMMALAYPASELRLALARWQRKTWSPEDLADYQHGRRSLVWRTDADGMVTFTLRLPPQVAAVLIALVSTIIMRSRPRAARATVAQQHADAFVEALTGVAAVSTEVVLHVRGDGCFADDGTPIPDTVIADLVPEAFLSVLVHDAAGRPVNASARRRHPDRRQKRVVMARDQACVDCGRRSLLHFDHNPPYATSGHTVVDELEVRCAPCHRRRHREQQ